ncbi:MAG: hypothetical protein A2X86_08215 [Bdellovibrionales bacterium GWA2_49_15]|nr:MAG: hypothetical protein A2X86_08215 [Bdellovibrionales bacterium GWA2_49_15]HAZ13172.1 hypothetical protein [Bdellovibrionales bacterium]
MIPLFHVEENKLTSLNGEVSTFFEILGPDLEGLDTSAVDRVFADLENDLINTAEVFKLYWLGGKLYLNCFGDISLTHGKIIPKNEPVGTFLNQQEARVQFYDNYLTLGNEYLRILSVEDFPESIGRFEANSYPDFVLCFKKIPKVAAKNKINFKRKLHFSALFKGMRDLDSENAYYQSEDLLNEVTTDNKALFLVECFFLVRAKTKESLDKETDRLLTEFKGKNGSLFKEERALSYFYQCLVPGVAPSFKRKLDLPSDYLSYLIPLHRDYIFEDGLELSSRSGNLVYVDLFHKDALNFNCLITGQSGQGKSMMANKILKFELERGTKALCLDLGNSFRKNALYGKGLVFSEKFNPLQFKSPRYLKEFVLSVIDERLGKKEEGRLFEVISKILEQGSCTNFTHFIGELGKEFSGIGYYFSEVEQYFTDEVMPFNDFTYCDFGNYPDAMKAPLIIYLIEYFKHLSGRKIFVFDECWHLLSKNADYIAECFRTFRKENASAMAISQNMDDFSETQLGRVIIQNTYFKLMFKQALSESEFLDATGKCLLDSVFSKKGVYSEFLFLSDTHKKPLRYYPTYLEYELFTSDKNDTNHFDLYMKEKGHFLPFKDAITNYTKIKNPQWGARENA